MCVGKNSSIEINVFLPREFQKYKLEIMGPSKLICSDNGIKPLANWWFIYEDLPPNPVLVN